MNEPFNIQLLVEKLSELNSSQQSIESLSSWCIHHRKKAKQIVETWDQVLSNTPKEHKVPFLYLANDILQNSRRKGSEFVNEFWKVLPACLKNVYENGEDNVKKVVNRLVKIWDERKVFGSRGQGLRDEILGGAPLPLDDGKSADALDNSKISNPIKLVRKDANTIRIKLAVGGIPEKIVTAYQSVLDEHFNEDTALRKSKDAIDVLDKLQKAADDACAEGKQDNQQLVSNIQEQETVLDQCFQQLEGIKATRIALITQLKEALKEQELKVEHVDNQLQDAQSQIQKANYLKQKLGLAMTTNGLSLIFHPPLTNSTKAMPAAEFIQPPKSVFIPPLPALQPVTTFPSTLSNADEDHKKAAAAVAARLTASTSSAQVLTSILSSLAAEEAASKNSGLSSGVVPGSPTIFPAEKRPRLEKPMPISEAGAAYHGHALQQPQLQGIPLSTPQVSAGSMQSLSQHNNQAQPTFTPPLPPLPPPPLQQYVSKSGATMGVLPFGFPLPPLPPLSSLCLARPGINPLPPPPPIPAHQQQQLQQQQQQTQQLQLTSMEFFQSNIGCYGQPQASPPVQRQ